MQTCVAVRRAVASGTVQFAEAGTGVSTLSVAGGGGLLNEVGVGTDSVAVDSAVTFNDVGSEVASFRLFDPLDIPWYVAWNAKDSLDSVHGTPTNGQPITGITDGSGNGRTGTPIDYNTHSMLYSATAMNGRPALDSTGGTQRRCALTGISLTAPFTLVGVVQMQTLSTYKGVLGNGTTANAILVGTAGSNAWREYAGTGFTNGTADTGAHLLIGEFSGGAGSIFTVDGSSVTGNPGAVTALDGFTIGSGANGSSGGGSYWVAFGAMINRMLTDLEKANLHAWSQLTYATP